MTASDAASMNVHLRLDGTWAVCRAEQRACPRLLHLPNVMPAVATGMPETFLWQLAELVDPPRIVQPHTKTWLDVHGRIHRDHDLPAVMGDDRNSWWQHNEIHRAHDRPAVVYANGTLEWWWQDKPHRDGGKPAVVTFEGEQIWYEHGVLKKHLSAAGRWLQ